MFGESHSYNTTSIFTWQNDFRGLSWKCFDRRGFRKSTKIAGCKGGNRTFLAEHRPNPIFNWSPVDREAYECLPVCTSEIKTNSTLPAFRARRDSLEIALRFSSCCTPWRMRVCMWVCSHEHIFFQRTLNRTIYRKLRAGNQSISRRSVLESHKTVALNYQDYFNIVNRSIFTSNLVNVIRNNCLRILIICNIFPSKNSNINYMRRKKKPQRGSRFSPL